MDGGQAKPRRKDSRLGSWARIVVMTSWTSQRSKAKGEGSRARWRTATTWTSSRSGRTACWTAYDGVLDKLRVSANPITGCEEERTDRGARKLWTWWMGGRAREPRREPFESFEKNGRDSYNVRDSNTRYGDATSAAQDDRKRVTTGASASHARPRPRLCLLVTSPSGVFLPG